MSDMVFGISPEALMMTRASECSVLPVLYFPFCRTASATPSGYIWSNSKNAGYSVWLSLECCRQGHLLRLLLLCCRRLAFQIRTSAALSERLPKALQHKGVPVVNAPKHNISYIPYPTAGMVNTGILYSLVARIRISDITLNLPCSRWKQRKPYHHIQIRKGSNHYGK